MSGLSLIDRLFDVIEDDIIPLTSEGVARGNKLYKFSMRPRRADSEAS